MRQRVLLSCLRLNGDNGGIVLDISEQGLAMQAAKSLGDDAYTQLRFQLSQSDDWVEARGRIAWMSTSRQTAGVEFIDLSYESLVSIKTWVSSIASRNASEEENAIPDRVAPPKSMLACDGAADVTSIPEPAKTDIVVEELVQELITEDLAAMLPSIGTRGAGGVSGNAGGNVPGENVSPTREFELTLPPRGVRSDGRPANNELPGVASKLSRPIGLLVGAAVLLALFIFYSVRRAASSLTAERATREKLSEAPSNGVTSSVMAPNTKGASSDDGFILQVAAMRSENSAILLASLLQRRGFPGYVFKPAAAKLYRVLVGPYGDADSAVKVEEKLRQQGFEAIRERNTPAQ